MALTKLDKPIFIIGIPRCGSTLWANIINAANEEIPIMREIYFLHPWYKDFRYFLRRIGPLSKDENIKKMIELIFSNENIDGINSWFWKSSLLKRVNQEIFKNQLYDKIRNSDKSLESLFNIITSEITTFLGYERYCSKFPVYFSYLDKLLEWYPSSKIIHATRDPRAIAMSHTHDRWTRKMISRYPYFRYGIKKFKFIYVIAQYIWSAHVHKRYRNVQNYQLFRFEDLLLKPEKTVKNLCKFVDLEFSPQMLHVGGQPSSLTNKKRFGFDASAVNRWKEYITPLELQLINTLTGQSMKILGYKGSGY